MSAITLYYGEPTALSGFLAMSSPVERFWDQYKDNVQHARRTRKYKFARLFWAFFLTILIAPICYALRDLTGSHALAVGFGLVAALFGLIVWWIIESFWRAASDRQEVAEAQVLQATPIGPAPIPATPAWQPPAAAQFAPPPAPARQSGGGLWIALAGVFAVLTLSCCGGGIAIATIASKWAAPNGIEAQQHPVRIDMGPAFPAPGDHLRDLQRLHDEQLDSLRKQQDEMRRQQEEMFRDLKSRRPGFGP
jgi:hypothetical protein